MAQSGMITLMGSGELTASMVEIHKMLIAELPSRAKITFLDTPAGFQPNADHISAGAVDYFKNRVLQPMGVASYKSHESISEVDAALALQKIRESHYILMGPGSPTYTIEQLRPTTIPAILEERILSGCCLTAASAAALTMGRYTLPVYEIYKVGQPLHWVKGLDMLSQFGLELVVIPHWNNAEGGTHDTSRCFMGRERFEVLLQKFDEPISILGLDEHTACIINLAADTFQVRGIGGVVLLQNGRSQVFRSGKTYPLAFLRGDVAESAQPDKDVAIVESKGPIPNDAGCGGGVNTWQKIQGFETQCRQALSEHNDNEAVAALLELDRTLWEALTNLNDPNILAEGRDLFRELIVLIGTRPRLGRQELSKALAPTVKGLLAAREQFRIENNWAAADAIRDALANAGVIVEDSESGFQWRLNTVEEKSNDQAS